VLYDPDAVVVVLLNSHELEE